MSAFKFIHITDSHIVPDGKKLCGLSPYERLVAALAHVNEYHCDAQFAVISGDLSYHGMEAGYEAVKDAVEKLSIPFYLMVGNHDDRDTFKEAFPEVISDDNGFIQYRIETTVGHFVIMDTAVMGAEYGILCPPRLAWLEQELATCGGKPVYLFLHHPPFDVGIPSLDAVGLIEGSDELARILAKYGNIKHLFYGHVHRPIWGSWNGIPTSTLPGTNHQVGLDLHTRDKMYGTHEPPGYGVCLINDTTVSIHLCNFLDKSPRFILTDPRSIRAQSVDELIPATGAF